MSLLQLPDSLQIWNNAAFDDGASASKISSTPPPPLREVSTNSFAQVDLDPSKENRGPEDIRPLLDAALPKKAPLVYFRDDAKVDDTALDDEISRIEEEIARLNSRLEALRAKKAERESRGRQPRGRIVPAKFMDPKQGSAARNPCTPASKRMDRAIEVTPARAGTRRRGVSLGPLEILATPGRPIGSRPSPAKNLWPSALKKKTEESPAPIEKADHQSGKANETPIGSVHDHKIPGLGKLENMEEDEEATKRNNFNPKSQPPGTAMKMPNAKMTLDTPGNANNRRRTISLGPLEIVASARFRWQNNLQEHTEKPVDKQPKRSSSISPASLKPSASAKKQVTDGADKGTKEGPFQARFRRQNNLQELTEKPVDKQAKRSSSISPASLKPSVSAKKQVVDGAAKGTKEGPFRGIIMRKALFQENQSSASCKRPSTAAKGRVVPSRYSLTTTTGEKQGNKRGKWSLPELSRGNTSALLTGSELEDQMKTYSQMLDDLDVVVSSLSFTPSSPQSIMKLAAMLPKIKTLRRNTQSPRDSGCAKGAAELAGRQPFLAVSEDEVLNSPLTFPQDKFADQQP
ncbi:uncharacterized protein LOC121993044 [Zingiber officinale]|uniref:uncharacterized protein LOC121993044 n=1 Tax=Zingiber officinale TaxID=94328 RepID=UPI001C4BC6CC|nr:uncharacterized protein LOC121993044 [Zingiber officinale]